MAFRTTLQPTCFGGLLVRAHGGWLWTDGVAEDRIWDIASVRADLTCRSSGDRRHVELPICLAETYDPLHWALHGVSCGHYDVDVSSGCFPVLGHRLSSSADHFGDQRQRAVAAGMMVILVPLTQWADWCVACPRLPVWDKDDEGGLQQMAIARGWSSAGTRPEDDLFG